MGAVVTAIVVACADATPKGDATVAPGVTKAAASTPASVSDAAARLKAYCDCLEKAKRKVLKLAGGQYVLIAAPMTNCAMFKVDSGAAGNPGGMGGGDAEVYEAGQYRVDSMRVFLTKVASQQ
jgi:hypothetical protein